MNEGFYIGISVYSAIVSLWGSIMPVSLPTHTRIMGNFLHWRQQLDRGESNLYQLVPPATCDLHNMNWWYVECKECCIGYEALIVAKLLLGPCLLVRGMLTASSREYWYSKNKCYPGFSSLIGDFVVLLCSWEFLLLCLQWIIENLRPEREREVIVDSWESYHHFLK